MPYFTRRTCARYSLVRLVVRAANYMRPTYDDACLLVAVFYQAVGTCERIVRYPIPLSYTRHTSRFMLLWLAFLPIALWDDARQGHAPCTVWDEYLVISQAALLLCEESGHDVELGYQYTACICACWPAAS